MGIIQTCCSLLASQTPPRQLQPNAFGRSLIHCPKPTLAAFVWQAAIQTPVHCCTQKEGYFLPSQASFFRIFAAKTELSRFREAKIWLRLLSSQFMLVTANTNTHTTTGLSCVSTCFFLCCVLLQGNCFHLCRFMSLSPQTHSC